jgi:flagellar biosynthesis protein FlhG
MSERIIAIAGGKGGVGKSVVALGLGDALARLGRSVTLVDLDLGASNMHTLLGHKRILCGIGAFVRGEERDFRGLAQQTDVAGLQFVPGTGLIPGVANAKYREKRRILSGLRKLKSDHILLDLGAGTSATTLDFFVWADRGIIVTAPMPSAILNAYEFLKNAVYRHLLRVFRSEPLVRSIIEQVNSPGNNRSISTIRQLADCVKDVSRKRAEMVVSASAGMQLSLILNFADGRNGTKMTERLCSIANRFLSVDIHRTGEIPYDWQIERLIRRLRPLTELSGDSLFRQSMTEIAMSLVEPSRSCLRPSAQSRLPGKRPRSLDEGINGKVVRSHVESIKVLAQLLNSYVLDRGPEEEECDSKNDIDDTESAESTISRGDPQARGKKEEVG